MAAADRSELRAALSSIPFEKLLELQRKEEALRAADTRKTVAAHDVSSSEESSEDEKTSEAPKMAKKHSRNAPEEISSKSPVGRFRHVVHAPRRAPIRDPRFDDLSGELHTHGFREAYSFLDSMRDQEEQVLTRNLKRARKKGDDAAAEETHRAIQAFRDKRKQDKREIEAQEQKREMRRANIERVARGAAPVWAKRRDSKRAALEKRFTEVHQKSGSAGVDRLVAQKLRRTGNAQRRRLPNTTRDDS